MKTIFSLMALLPRRDYLVVAADEGEPYTPYSQSVFNAKEFHELFVECDVHSNHYAYKRIWEGEVKENLFDSSLPHLDWFSTSTRKLLM